MATDELKSTTQLLLISHKLLVVLILLGINQLYWQTLARDVNIWLMMLIVTYGIGLYGCSLGKPVAMRVHIITSSLLWVLLLIFGMTSGFPAYKIGHLVLVLVILVLFPVAAFFTHKFAAIHEEEPPSDTVHSDNQAHSAV